MLPLPAPQPGTQGPGEGRANDLSTTCQSAPLWCLLPSCQVTQQAPPCVACLGPQAKQGLCSLQSPLGRQANPPPWCACVHKIGLGGAGVDPMASQGRHVGHAWPTETQRQATKHQKKVCFSSILRVILPCIVKRLFNAWAETQTSKKGNFWIYKHQNFD